MTTQETIYAQLLQRLPEVSKGRWHRGYLDKTFCGYSTGVDFEGRLYDIHLIRSTIGINDGLVDYNLSVKENGENIFSRAEKETKNQPQAPLGDLYRTIEAKFMRKEERTPNSDDPALAGLEKLLKVL